MGSVRMATSVMGLVPIVFVAILSQSGLARGERRLKENKTPKPTPEPSREPTWAPTPHPTLIETYEPSAQATQVYSPSIGLDSDSNDSSAPTARTTRSPSAVATFAVPTSPPPTANASAAEGEDADVVFVDLPEMTLSLTMPDTAAAVLNITSTVSTHILTFINGAFEAEFAGTEFHFFHTEVLVLPVKTSGTRRVAGRVETRRSLQPLKATLASIEFLLTQGKAVFSGTGPSEDLLNFFLGQLFANDETAVNQFHNFGDSLKESGDETLSQVVTYDFTIINEQLDLNEDIADEGVGGEATTAGVDTKIEQDSSPSSKSRDVMVGALVGIFAATVVIVGAFVIKRQRQKSNGPTLKRIYSEEVEGDVMYDEPNTPRAGEELSCAGLSVEDSMMSPGTGYAESWASINDKSATMPTYDARRLEKIISMSNAVVSSSSADQAKLKT